MIITPGDRAAQAKTGADILLTGLPRSGTSLACRLLNQVPGTIALNEPLTLLPAGDTPAQQACALLATCRRLRSTILTEQRYWTHQTGGAVTDAMFAATPDATGRRPRIATPGWVTLPGPVAPDFTLVIKHTSLFVPLLAELVSRLPVFALIRHPLPVLVSWQGVDATLARGEPGAAGALDTGLQRRLEATPAVLDRQLVLLDWFFTTIAANISPAAILRYESLVASRGRALRAVVPGAANLDEPLTDRNRPLPLSQGELASIATRLLASDGAYWRFYPRDSVADLLAEIG